MITYVNNANASRYSTLFIEATEALKQAYAEAEAKGENGLDVGIKEDAAAISTIEQYFAYLPKLIKLGASSDKYTNLRAAGRRYAILPLDEEYFEINANARTISVPRFFASYGVAVQGDQLAEVLYFKVDRFFDAKDLDDTNIYIQWVNANGEQGVSSPFVVDIESEPNKLIFGWALPNSVTCKQGDIKFAVRFYEWANEEAKDKLSFSLGTQTASIKVNSTLDFSLDTDNIANLVNTDEDNLLLVERIKTSETYVTGREKAAVPVYIINLSADNNSNIIDNNGVLLADLNDDGEFVFKVQAKSTDAGTINYEWSQEGVVSRAQGETLFEKTKDTQLGEKVYYIKDVDKSTETMPAYKIYTATTFPDDPNVEVYEKFSTYTATSIGKYHATAINNKDEQNISKLDSNVVEILAPSVPRVETNFSDNPEDRIVTEEKPVVLSVSVENSESNGSRPGEVTYKWQVDHERDGNYKDVELGEDEIFSNKLEIAYNEDSKKVEGNYRVIVYNTKNKETVEFNDENESTYISYAPQVPELEPIKDEDGKVLETVNARIRADKTLTREIRVNINEDWANDWSNQQGILKYTWYKAGNTDEALETESMNENTDDSIIEGANEATFVPEESGIYFCAVTNIKNGVESSAAISQPFSVVG